MKASFMEKTAQPVRKNPEKINAVVQEMAGHWPEELELDLGNTEYAFAHRSDQELKKVARLFGLMNNHWLVGIGSKLGLAAIRMHLPLCGERGEIHHIRTVLRWYPRCSKQKSRSSALARPAC
jgi:hypothetical protein